MDNIERELGAVEKMDRPHYFEDLGFGHDHLLRCKDCQTLVTYQTITKIGMCPGDETHACGNRRFALIQNLNQKEWDDIVSGKIDFEYRDLFLAEFSATSHE